MPTISSPPKERTPGLGGGGPGKIPSRRGYGGGDDGDRRRPEKFLSYQNRLRRYRIGVALFSVCVSMLFLGIASVYVARQRIPYYDQNTQAFISTWKAIHLPYVQLWINSLLIVAGSITLELARRGQIKKAEFASMGILPPGLEREVPWLTITLLLGAGFLAGQLLVWNNLRHQGVYLRANASGAFFYTLTGLHAIHLVGGMAVLVYALLGSWLRRRFESQQISVDATGWYWHFMGFLWFCIFALLHFSRA